MKSKKNSKFNFSELSVMDNSVIEKIIKNIAINFDDYNESYGYGVFLSKNKDGSIELKDKEENKKNNYKHEQAIKETLDCANLIEKILNEQTCCRKFEKITQDEIILHGNSALKNEILYKIKNDIKNKLVTVENKMSKKVKVAINNILFDNQNINKFFNNQEILKNNDKIGIIDKNNNVMFLDINELNRNSELQIRDYFVPTMQFQTNNIAGQNEQTTKYYIFSNKDEAIRKIQEISKNNAGLLKEYMTGGVEFENPKIFKNFIENFYTFKEHIIAFKCEKNTINDIKNTLKRILNNDIIINSIQEVWETILDELIDGYLIGGSLPFISLHFNENGLLY